MKLTYFSLAGLTAAGTISFDRSLPSTVLQEIDFEDWMAKHDISFTQDEAAGRLKHFLNAKKHFLRLTIFFHVKNILLRQKTIF